jgi:hypothetical protein
MELLGGILMGVLTEQHGALTVLGNKSLLGDSLLDTEPTPAGTDPTGMLVPVCKSIRAVDATAGDDMDMDDLPFFGGGANSISFETK